MADPVRDRPGPDYPGLIRPDRVHGSLYTDPRVGSVGPAGMLLADDTEMYERNQRGVAMLRPEWLDLRRGLHRERTDERGLKVGTASDETAMRGFWAHYLSLMEAA